eukprot:gene16673-8112_t
MSFDLSRLKLDDDLHQYLGKFLRFTAHEKDIRDVHACIELPWAVTYTGAESEGFIAPTLNDIYEDSICKSIFPSAELDKREATPSQFLIAICFNRGADSLNTANKSTSTAMKKETRRRRVNTRQKVERPRELKIQAQQSYTKSKSNISQLQPPWTSSKYQGNFFSSHRMPQLETGQVELANRYIDNNLYAGKPAWIQEMSCRDSAKLNNVNGNIAELHSNKGVQAKDFHSNKPVKEVQTPKSDTSMSKQDDCNMASKRENSGTAFIIVKPSQDHHASIADNIRVLQCNRTDVTIKSLKFVEQKQKNESIQAAVKPIRDTALNSSFLGQVTTTIGETEGIQSEKNDMIFSSKEKRNLEEDNCCKGKTEDRKTDGDLCCFTIKSSEELRSSVSQKKQGMTGPKEERFEIIGGETSERATTTRFCKNSDEGVNGSDDDMNMKTVPGKETGAMKREAFESANANKDKSVWPYLQSVTKESNNKEKGLETSKKGISDSHSNVLTENCALNPLQGLEKGQEHKSLGINEAVKSATSDTSTFTCANPNSTRCTLESLSKCVDLGVMKETDEKQVDKVVVVTSKSHLSVGDINCFLDGCKDAEKKRETTLELEDKAKRLSNDAAVNVSLSRNTANETNYLQETGAVGKSIGDKVEACHTSYDEALHSDICKDQSTGERTVNTNNVDRENVSAFSAERLCYERPMATDLASSKDVLDLRSRNDTKEGYNTLERVGDDDTNVLAFDRGKISPTVVAGTSPEDIEPKSGHNDKLKFKKRCGQARKHHAVVHQKVQPEKNLSHVSKGMIAGINKEQNSNCEEMSINLRKTRRQTYVEAKKPRIANQQRMKTRSYR